MTVALPDYTDVAVTRVADSGDLALAAVRSSSIDGSDIQVRTTLRTEIVRAVAYSGTSAGMAVWGRCDGMGDLPPEAHEFDWSAIRDSSPGAWAAMYAAAVQVLPRQVACSRLGVDDPAPGSDGPYLASAPVPVSPGQPFTVDPAAGTAAEVPPTNRN